MQITTRLRAKDTRDTAPPAETSYAAVALPVASTHVCLWQQGEEGEGGRVWLVVIVISCATEGVSISAGSAGTAGGRQIVGCNSERS